MTDPTPLAAEKAQPVQSIEGHAVVAVDGRFKCLLCGAKLLSVMQFNLTECRGVR